MKHFNSGSYKTSLIIIVCCILHKYYEMCGAPKLGLANTKIRGDNLISWILINCLLLEKKKGKIEGETLRKVFFVNNGWLIIQLNHGKVKWVSKWNLSFFSQMEM